MSTPARTPKPPYLAVIFTTTKSDRAGADYAVAAEPGYLGVDTVRGPDGLGITVSDWRDEGSIGAWKRNVEHTEFRRLGRERWYDRYELRVAKVERAYGFTREKLDSV